MTSNGLDSVAGFNPPRQMEGNQHNHFNKRASAKPLQAFEEYPVVVRPNIIVDFRNTRPIWHANRQDGCTNSECLTDLLYVRSVADRSHRLPLCSAALRPAPCAMSASAPSLD